MARRQEEPSNLEAIIGVAPSLIVESAVPETRFSGLDDGTLEGREMSEVLSRAADEVNLDPIAAAAKYAEVIRRQRGAGAEF